MTSVDSMQVSDGCTGGEAPLRDADCLIRAELTTSSGARIRRFTPASRVAPDSKFKKKKTRRGKSKRRTTKPYLQRRPRSTHAPYNTNQFLMEEHMPEVLHESRTRDSSFSVDSEDNYFYPLPQDEEDFLTKEFSSVYEDAQSERLTNMSKDELLNEYLSLQAKYEALAKRLARCEAPSEETSVRIQQQEETIRELRAANQALTVQLVGNTSGHNNSSSADSESDSDSDSASSSCSTSSDSIADYEKPLVNGHASPEGPILENGHDRSPDRLMNGHAIDTTPRPD